ncbi:ABC transporter permease [Clostridium thermosuccinogenes]|uniref:ABC transporter permease n=1 Tax=Clostridium thermosuccinogenes TaxID=84032 RepID=UPI001930EA11|nr:ABC transporter permease [Pseudoclostridium thermosuccinogenes]
MKENTLQVNKSQKVFTATAKKSKRKDKHKQPLWVTISRLGIIAAILVGIELAVSQGYVNKIFLASPSQIADEFTYMLRQNELLPQIMLTLQEALLGYAISAVVGIGIGVLFVTFPKLEALLTPFFSAIMAVPKTAVMPLLIVWFGIGFKSKVIMVFLFCMFTVLFNTVSGAKQTKVEHLKVAHVFKATRAQIVFKVLIPSALPGIFTGLRVTAATAITGVIFAEMTASKGGAGYLLSEAQAVLNTPKLYLVVIILTLLSVLFVSIVNLAERIVFRHQRTI